MILTIVLTIITTFGSGLFLGLLLQYLKNRKTKDILTNHMIMACKDILKNYKYYSFETDRAASRVMFPQIHHIIYSGQLHYFDFEIQDKMAQILMQEKGLDDIVRVIIEQSFSQNSLKPSKLFDGNYKITQKNLLKMVKELLVLLE